MESTDQRMNLFKVNDKEIMDVVLNFEQASHIVLMFLLLFDFFKGLLIICVRFSVQATYY